jgi:transposase
MRKSRFTETQIIGMIKEQEAGMPMSELCRRHGLGSGPINFGDSQRRLFLIQFRQEDQLMSDQFWLSEAQLNRIKPCFPRPHGVPRVDDRKVISGIIHVICYTATHL